MSAPQLVALDWGTSRLRAYLLTPEGEIVERREDGPGIMSVEQGGFARAFDAFAGDWARAPHTLVTIAAGMVGSRQGWVEAPYAPCPAGIAELAAGIARADAPGGQTVYLVPGLCTDTPGRAPDVMRGEETQLVGALGDVLEDAAGDSIALLPGTHSKWATLRNGRVAGFNTYMTGELFALLAEHSILGRMMDGTSHDSAGFERGAAMGLDGAGLLGQLFSARTLALFDRLEKHAVRAYLSGLLIGAEVREALAANSGVAGPVTIIGGEALAARYEQVLGLAGIESQRGDPDAAARGLARIARAAGLLGQRT